MKLDDPKITYGHPTLWLAVGRWSLSGDLIQGNMWGASNFLEFDKQNINLNNHEKNTEI